MFAGKKSAQIREILINESAWEDMTCLFAPSLVSSLKQFRIFEEDQQNDKISSFTYRHIKFIVIAIRHFRITYIRLIYCLCPLFTLSGVNILKPPFIPNFTPIASHFDYS